MARRAEIGGGGKAGDACVRFIPPLRIDWWGRSGRLAMRGKGTLKPGASEAAWAKTARISHGVRRVGLATCYQRQLRSIIQSCIDGSFDSSAVRGTSMIYHLTSSAIHHHIDPRLAQARLLFQRIYLHISQDHHLF